MESSDILVNINSMRIRFNILKIFNIFIAMFFCLFGSVSIVFLLMNLYLCYNFSLFGCFILDCILPYVYSTLVKRIMKPIDTKIKDSDTKLKQLEHNFKLEQEKNIMIKNVMDRFNRLNIGNQILVLNFIRDNCLISVNDIKNIDNLGLEDIYMIRDKLNLIQGINNNSEYTKRKTL